MAREIKDIALEVVKAISPITIAIVILQFTLIRMPLLLFAQGTIDLHRPPKS